MHTLHFTALVGTIAAALLVNSKASAEDLDRPFRSATIAREINGIALGTRIEEVGRTVRLEAVGGGDYDGWHDGIEYDFGVTPLGRVYRIGMQQKLGNFLIDAPFIQSLEERLFAKYGTPPIGRNPWSWQLVEVVKDAEGNEFAQETNWMTASVSSGFDTVNLSLKMLDFRILWDDIGSLNQAPRYDALEMVQF